MSLLYKNVKQLVFDIDVFIDTVEQGVLVFKEGVVNYINGEKASFADKIERINRLEATADKLQRKIDDQFYRHSILPQNASDIGGMLDKIDEIIDIAKDNLYQFDDELPFIPKELKNAVIFALADLRWQVAKETASYYWMEEGLTGKYYHWFT